MIPIIAVRYVGKHLIKRRSRRMPRKAALYGVAILGCVLILTFAVVDAEMPKEVLVSMEGRVPIVQSAAVAKYVQADCNLARGVGGPTTVDLTQAYIDAKDVVPPYNAAFTQTKDSIIMGVNSPTKDPSDNAYVVNLIPLMTAEVQDLINFEKSLGVTGHKDPEDYVLEQLKVAYSCFPKNGFDYGSSYQGVVGGVGPAITIRDFYANNHWKDGGTIYWDVFGGKENAFIDVLWVNDRDVDAYLKGQDVDILYMQVKLIDAKAHNAPWGVNQTYFYMDFDTGMMQPHHDRGSAYTLCRGGAPQGGDEVSNLKELLKVAKDNENSPGVYCWPTLEATSADLGMQFGAPPEWFSMPADTWSVLECGANNSSNVQIPTVFAGCTMVGILVYAK